MEAPDHQGVLYVVLNSSFLAWFNTFSVFHSKELHSHARGSRQVLPKIPCLKLPVAASVVFERMCQSLLAFPPSFPFRLIVPDSRWRYIPRCPPKKVRNWFGLARG